MMKKNIFIWIIVSIAIPGVLAVLLYHWAAYLYRESPWSLPDWAEEWFEKDEDDPKPLHWYTKINWQLDDSADIGAAPPIYGHSGGASTWALLLDRLGFEPVGFEPGLDLLHPEIEGRRIRVDGDGSIRYYAGIREDEEKNGLFGDAAYEKAVSVLTELGIDLTHYEYLGTSDAIGDTESLRRTLRDGTIEYASSDRSVYFDLKADGYKFCGRSGPSLAVGFYYDQLYSIEFHNYMPIPGPLSYGDGDIYGAVTGRVMEKRLRKSGVYIRREMESIKTVTVEDAHFYYLTSPDGQYYEPYLEISGHASDGYINAPFQAYVYALEKESD